MMLRFTLALLVMALPAAAAAKWREASSRHFIIYSEESEESLRRFAERLERYDGAIRQLRNVPKDDPGPANRLTVYVVSGMDDVRKLARGQSSIAGFYIPRASGSIAIVPRRIGGGGSRDITSQRVLLHEYAHHFMFHNFPAAYPLWFSEGFAEFLSTAEFKRDGEVQLGIPAAHRSYGLMSGNPLSIERLLDPGDKKLDDLQSEAIYGRGWLLTHYLTFEQSRRGQLAVYLKELNAGAPSLDAARKAFGDLDKLSRELDTYLRLNKFRYYQVSPQAIEVGPIAVRELRPGEDAVMDFKIVSRRGVTLAEAKALLPKMRRAAAPFPDDPAVQATLAEAEYDAGNDREALAAAERAVARDPKYIDGLIYRAMVKMRMADAAADDEEAWKDARRAIGLANRADPDHPQPLILFYNSFLRQGIEPTANAVTGLEYAYALAPHDMGLRLQAARQYLIDGKRAQARLALVPIAFSPHGGAAADAASAVLAALDAGTPADALAAWKEPQEAD